MDHKLSTDLTLTINKSSLMNLLSKDDKFIIKEQEPSRDDSIIVLTTNKKQNSDSVELF